MGCVRQTEVMSVEERVNEAEERLEDWIRNAVEETQQELFEGSDAILDDEELKELSRIDQKMKESGEGSLWADVEYQIYRSTDEGDGDSVALDTFGVPRLPDDVDVDDDLRETLNEALSEYGVELSNRVERQFESWLES